MDAHLTDLEVARSRDRAAKIQRILIVDDDADGGEVLGLSLNSQGYEVTLAPDGLTALQLLDHRKFDLVLLDVMMPEMNGLDVLRKIREIYSAAALPVIMATAKDQSEDIAQALNLGANDYVVKPLDFVVLLARIQTQLALKQAAENVIELQIDLCKQNHELQQANARLNAINERVSLDLRAAARVQEAFLPNSYRRTPSLDFEWCFEPCDHLAGDFLNICPLDEENVGFYVLDVSGHGVAASLLAMAAARSLSPTHDPESLLTRVSADTGRLEPSTPAQVADRLNQKFAWDLQTDQFLTIFYALINSKTRVLTYASAGHPGAVLLNPGEATTILAHGGPPISMGTDYSDYKVSLKPGARVYLYSDGVIEAMNDNGDLFGQKRLLQSVERLKELPLRTSVSELAEEIRQWRGEALLRDDVSILALECLW